MLSDQSLEMLALLPVEPIWAAYPHLKRDLQLSTQAAVGRLRRELVHHGVAIQTGKIQLDGRWVLAARLKHGPHREAQKLAEGLTCG